MEEKKDVIIALDEGTTNAKAIAIDGAGRYLPDRLRRWLSKRPTRDGLSNLASILSKHR